MSQSVIVYGAGRIGIPTVSFFQKLGYKVTIADVSEEAINSLLAHESVDDRQLFIQSLSKDNPDYVLEDLVVSCMPYHQNLALASKCIRAGVFYADLGGSVKVSQKINRLAKEKQAIVMTDLGLAPGLVGIIAEEGYRQLSRVTTVTDCQIRVGGNPNIIPDNPLKYTVTWSIDGLINEYKANCEVLYNGEIEVVKAMSGLQTFFGEVEEFYTSGGIAHLLRSMKSKGLLNCDYKTLRYSGHCDIVKYLLESNCEDALRQMLTKACPQLQDVVYLDVLLFGDKFTWQETKTVYGDLALSAMQKTTAAGLVAAVDAINSAMRYPSQPAFPHRPLTYEDVPYDLFSLSLAALLPNSDLTNDEGVV